MLQSISDILGGEIASESKPREKQGEPPQIKSIAWFYFCAVRGGLGCECRLEIERTSEGENTQDNQMQPWCQRLTNSGGTPNDYL